MVDLRNRHIKSNKTQKKKRINCKMQWAQADLTLFLLSVQAEMQFFIGGFGLLCHFASWLLLAGYPYFFQKGAFIIEKPLSGLHGQFRFTQ